jgi:hypothetical protein
MSTPLTDSINALTRYANETTGASDTTLSDAVETLVEGFSNESNFEDFSGGNITAIIMHSNGGQNGSYINTGYFPHGNANIYCKIAVTQELYVRYGNIFGAFFGNAISSACRRIGCQMDMGSNLIYICSYYADTGSINTNVALSDEPKIIKGASLILLPTDIATVPLLIANGYYRTENTKDVCGGMIFYGLKAYENGKLVKKYVPWLDDNEIPCVRELIDDEYFYNAGVNNFGYIDLNGNIIEE